MTNILGSVANWLRHDLELEHTLQVQDLRLIKLGFSYDEVMGMMLDERIQYLEIGSNISQIDDYQKAMLGVEVGALSGGFTDKKTRNKLYGRWDKVLKTASNNLEFGVEVGNPESKEASASKKSPHRKSGVRSFKDVMGRAIARKETRKTDG
jgi:hypothetical protein